MPINLQSGRAALPQKEIRWCEEEESKGGQQLALLLLWAPCLVLVQAAWLRAGRLAPSRYLADRI